MDEPELHEVRVGDSDWITGDHSAHGRLSRVV